MSPCDLTCDVGGAIHTFKDLSEIRIQSLIFISSVLWRSFSVINCVTEHFQSFRPIKES